MFFPIFQVSDSQAHMRAFMIFGDEFIQKLVKFHNVWKINLLRKNVSAHICACE
eukprot:UN18589